MCSRKDGSRADGDGGNQASMNKIRNTELALHHTDDKAESADKADTDTADSDSATTATSTRKPTRRRTPGTACRATR